VPCGRASHLRPGGVALVTAAALVGDALTLFALLPAAAAFTDFRSLAPSSPVMAVILFRANGTQERLVAALQEQATVDSLTGLATRRAFDNALEIAMARSVPGGTALVLIDVDSFKTINDSHGHPVGDDVLVHLSTVLRGQVRAEDAVLSRLGGDELAVLLPGCIREVAVRRAEDLHEAVRSTPLPLSDAVCLRCRSASVSPTWSSTPPTGAGSTPLLTTRSTTPSAPVGTVWRSPADDLVRVEGVHGSALAVG
jgi:diguanylate cyclase (GGDEF)-like protein